MQSLKHTHTIIQLKNINFYYSNHHAIKDYSLQIHRGDYLGIIGPNGGGKSTLIKLMVNLLKPESGEIDLFGQEISKFRDWYKIGYVPQRATVEQSLPVTVEEIVSMARFAKRGLFKSLNNVDREAVKEALMNVDMYEYKNFQIRNLSGGQQQRVFIARALASEPEVVFLDEPTVGVDVKTQKQFYALLRKLNRELNLTLVLASHELDVVAHEATELAYVNRELVYYGDPEEFIKGKYFHELIGRGGLHH